MTLILPGHVQKQIEEEKKATVAEEAPAPIVLTETQIQALEAAAVAFNNLDDTTAVVFFSQPNVLDVLKFWLNANISPVVSQLIKQDRGVVLHHLGKTLEEADAVAKMEGKVSPFENEGAHRLVNLLTMVLRDTKIPQVNFGSPEKQPAG